MADIFRVAYSQKESARIRKEIRDRVEGCFEPNCWNLKADDTGQIYLDRNMIAGGKGRYVQIRRLLFLTTWKTLPDRRKLIMRCHNYRCVNPAHATYKGFKPPYDIVNELLKGNAWLTQDQARKWYELT
jgi:hypothetical protein